MPHMGRPRDSKNRNLRGTNISTRTAKGKVYYYYIMPDGTLEALVHGDEQASIEAAIALNNALRPSGNVVETILKNQQLNRPRPSRTNPRLTAAIEQYIRIWLPEQDYSKRYLQATCNRLNQYAKHWPYALTGDIQTVDISSFLNQFKPEPARQHLSLLKTLFKFIASQGYQQHNPCAQVIMRKRQERVMVRHNWEAVQVIREHSDTWLRDAIDLALLTLQRRSDLIELRNRIDANLKDNYIRVRQQKTGVYIQIQMGGELNTVVKRSISAAPLSSYLVKKTFKNSPARRDLPSHQRNKLTPDYLTRAFKDARDASGVYDHLEPEQRPGFHALRALGIFMYVQAGFDEQYIMALSGHATEKMHHQYKDGHEQQKPVAATAGLDLFSLDLSNVDWATSMSPELLKIADSEE